MNTSIKDFVDVGDPAAPIGSPAWCQAAHVQLCATKRQTDWEVRRLKYDLLEFKNKERWKQLASNKGRPFRSWEQYVRTPEPNGLGMPPGSVNAVLEAEDNTLIGHVLKTHGGDRKSEEFQNQGDHSTLKRGSTSAAYIKARLERDGYLDLLAEVEFQGLSARQAAIQAGYIKGKTIIQQLRDCWKKANPEERETFRKEIDNENL